MVGEQTCGLKVRGQKLRDFHRTEIVEVIPLVPGITVPIDAEQVVFKVQIHILAAQFLGKLVDPVVFGSAPVDGAGRAYEEKLCSMAFAQLLDLFHIVPIEGEDLLLKLGGLHMILIRAGADFGTEPISLVLVSPGIGSFFCQVLPGEIFPPVVVAENGKPLFEPGHKGGLRADLSVDSVGFQDDYLGRLILKRSLEKRIGVIQGLAAGGAKVGSISCIPPDLQRRDGGIGFTVSQHQHVNGVILFSQDAVSLYFFHAGFHGIVFGGEQEGGSG